MSYKTCILVVLCFLQVAVKCQKCEDDKIGYYYYSGVKLVCTDIKGSFPNFTKTVKSIRCIYCDIPVLDKNTLSNFSGETFNLSYSHVKTIASTVFDSFTNRINVHTLLLNDNEISSIAPNLFNNFSMLDEINFRNNKLVNLEEETFGNMNISTLDLSMNKIVKLDKIFTGLRVVKLNLSSNNIGDISEDTFDKVEFWAGRHRMSGFRLLDLSWNFIENIKPNTFKAGSSDNKLIKLYLIGNKIKKIENSTFSQLSYLTYLSLENNDITELNTNSFKGLVKLTELVLRHNYIKEIPQNMLANLLLLEDLDLSHNHIQTLNYYTFSGPSQIKTLNISHNNLQVLDEMHLLPMGRLTKLDISNNAIKTLNLQPIMEHHHLLRYLVLNNNYWMCKNLVQMYKILNQRIGGFSLPSHYFDVPNLHGIACSRTNVEMDDFTSFDDFLSLISQDQVFEDLYDSRLTNNADLSNSQNVLELIKTANGIYYIVLTIMLMYMIIFLQRTAKHVCNYLHTRNILSDRFSLKYAHNQDSVALI